MAIAKLFALNANAKKEKYRVNVFNSKIFKCQQLSQLSES